MTKWKNLLYKFAPSQFFIKFYIILLVVLSTSALLAYISGQTLISKALGMCALWPLFGLLLSGGVLYGVNKRKNE